MKRAQLKPQLEEVGGAQVHLGLLGRGTIGCGRLLQSTGGHHVGAGQGQAVVAAAHEERFSRKKHDNGYPEQAIEFCLRKAGITANDLDYVVFYEKPLQKFERFLMTSLGFFPKS